jgi:hypothetical protein
MGDHVTDQTPKPAGGKRPATRRPSPMRFVLPIALGLVVGSVLYYGYTWWSQHKGGAQAAADAPGDADLDKPAADECAMARAAAAAVHAAGDDKRWEAGAAQTTMSLGAHSKVINTADFAGFGDDESASLNAKAPADWRWCPGIAASVAGLGWSAMGSDYGVAVLLLGRPGVDKAGDEAKLYEAFAAPKEEGGAPFLAKGPWLVTLHKAPTGAWQVVKRDDLKKFY